MLGIVGPAYVSRRPEILKPVVAAVVVDPETEGIPAVRATCHSIAGHRKVARAAMCVAHKQSRRMGFHNQELLRRRVGRSR